jgi:DDE superfamily endonuclease
LDHSLARRQTGRTGLCRTRRTRNGTPSTEKNEPKPWFKEQYCIPPEANAAFVCQMEEVLDIYTRPYDARHPQVCLDETSKQLVSETRVPIPAEPGQVERFDYEYERQGVYSLFMCFEPLTGKQHVTVSAHRTKQDFAQVLRNLVDVQYPNAEKIILVLDNLNTHDFSALYETFEPEEAWRIREKIEIHYTPKHGSWLNMAEIELAVLNGQCLDRRIGEEETLRQEVAAWEAERNEQQIKVN